MPGVVAQAPEDPVLIGTKTVAPARFVSRSQALGTSCPAPRGTDRQPAQATPDVIRRGRTIEETLRLALEVSDRCGIAGVSDLTALDDLGVAVFACLRPNSRSDALTFGKGRSAVEAEVGARMEALEFHCAEPGHSSASETFFVGQREFAERAQANVEDFIPLAGASHSTGEDVAVVHAKNVETEQDTLVPAELVFRPAPGSVQRRFGTSTNGLASGNSLEEASACSLLELIERDIWSLELARQGSRWVDPDTLPTASLDIRERILQRGLRLSVRAVTNDYGLPFFACFLHDPGQLVPAAFHGGWGCSFDPEQALMQALNEVVQGRIGMLHGGRRPRLQGASGEDLQAALREQVRRVDDPGSPVAFPEVRGVPLAACERPLEKLLSVLRRCCDGPVHRVALTDEGEPLQVVRLVVPGLEHYRVGRPRIGRRLERALREAASERRIR